MATTADTSRDAQAAIALEASRLAAKAWPDVDFNALRATLPGFKRQVAAAVYQFAPMSRAAALRFYAERRSAAGIPGRARFNAVPLPPLEQIDKSVDWAAQPLWGASDIATAEKRLEAVVEGLVLDAGRDQIISNVEQDRKATAYARVPEAGCCSWCAMLATRGAVYRTAKSAGEGRQFHNHDRCHVEPVFNAYEPSAQVRQWQAEWANLKRELGYSPSLNEWRRHFDGLAPVE